MTNHPPAKPDFGHVRQADAARIAEVQKRAREVELDLLKKEAERAKLERDLTAESRRRDRETRQRR